MKRPEMAPIFAIDLRISYLEKKETIQKDVTLYISPLPSDDADTFIRSKLKEMRLLNLPDQYELKILKSQKVGTSSYKKILQNNTKILTTWKNGKPSSDGN